MKNGRLIMMLRGGMTNRLRAMASAVRAAKITGRELFIGWVPGAGCEMEYTDFFEPIKDVQIVPDEDELADKAFNVAATVGVRDDIKQWNNAQNLLSITCGGIMSAGVAVAECARLSRKSIKLKPELVAFVEAYSKKHFKGKVLGLHIRAQEHFLTLCPLEKYEQLLDGISENVRVYLATDCPHTAKHMIKRYNKWHSFFSRLFCPGVKILYIKKTIGRDSNDGMRGAVIDMYLLNRCLRIYGTVNSCFNWMASIIENDVPLIKVGK